MKKLNFVFFLLFSVCIFSQMQTQKPYIEVTGISETEIVPNEIYLDICLKERNEKGKKLTIDFLEKQLKSTLKTIGIPEENLSISDIKNILSKTGLWKKEILSFTNYTLKVGSVSKLKKLFESFKELKVFRVDIAKAIHSDIIKIKKENRIKAINAAKEKADYLLSAIGEETGKAILVREIDLANEENYNNMLVRAFNSSNKYYSESPVGYGAKEKPIEFKKIKITSSIYVKFLIK